MNIECLQGNKEDQYVEQHFSKLLRQRNGEGHDLIERTFIHLLQIRAFLTIHQRRANSARQDPMEYYRITAGFKVFI